MERSMRMRYSKNTIPKERYNFERIAELRKDKGLKQAEMATILNMSQRNYSHIEVGDYDIPTEVLIKLCIFFDVSSDYLLGLTDERLPYPKQNKQLKIKQIYPIN